MQLYNPIVWLNCVGLLAVCSWAVATGADNNYTTDAVNLQPLATLNQTCESSADCASNQQCRTKISDDGWAVSQCQCGNRTSWDPVLETCQRMNNVTYPPTINETCNSAAECDSNQQCLSQWTVDGDYLNVCTCSGLSIWDQDQELCRGPTGAGNSTTYQQNCVSWIDCDAGQDCKYQYAGFMQYAQRCDCIVGFNWDPALKMCRYMDCNEFCTSPDYGCYNGDCVQCVYDGVNMCYDYIPPVQDYYPPQSSGNSALFYLIVGLFLSTMLIVMCAWKCSARRRLMQQSMIGPSVLVDMQQHRQQAPMTPDEPPKYSNLVPPIWWSTQSATSTPINNDPRQTSAGMDSPPPYSEVSAYIAANNTRSNTA